MDIVSAMTQQSVCDIRFQFAQRHSGCILSLARVNARQASSSSMLYKKDKLISHTDLPMQPRTAHRLFQDQANALQASGFQMPCEKSSCEATMTCPLQPRAEQKED